MSNPPTRGATPAWQKEVNSESESEEWWEKWGNGEIGKLIRLRAARLRRDGEMGKWETKKLGK